MSSTDVGAALPKPRLDILPALTPLIIAANPSRASASGR